MNRRMFLVGGLGAAVAAPLARSVAPLRLVLAQAGTVQSLADINPGVSAAGVNDTLRQIMRDMRAVAA